MKRGYFQSINGNRSSTRLIGFVVIAGALIFAQEVIWYGRNDIVQAAIAAGTIFVTVGGPTLAFLFAQKRTEVGSEKQKETE